MLLERLRTPSTVPLYEQVDIQANDYFARFIRGKKIISSRLKHKGSTSDSNYSQIITIHDQSKLEGKLEFLLRDISRFNF